MTDKERLLSLVGAGRHAHNRIALFLDRNAVEYPGGDVGVKRDLSAILATLGAKDAEIERLRGGGSDLVQWASRSAAEIDAGTTATAISRPINGVRYMLRDYASYEQEIEALRSRALAAEARLAEAEKVIEPFAAAASDIEENDRDGRDIWEDGIAMEITIGHLRAARAFIAKEPT